MKITVNQLKRLIKEEVSNMSNQQIPESDQKFIDSLSNIATVKQDKRGILVYTIRDFNHNCHIQLEFNPVKNDPHSWKCKLYSYSGNVLYEEGSNLQKIIQILIQREMKFISRMLDIDLVNHYDSLKNFSNDVANQ